MQLKSFDDFLKGLHDEIVRLEFAHYDFKNQVSKLPVWAKTFCPSDNIVCPSNATFCEVNGTFCPSDDIFYPRDDIFCPNDYFLSL